MKYNPEKHHRMSIRIPGYDYSQDGYYFITICTNRHMNLFGEIIDGVMNLNEYGIAAKNNWEAIPEHFPNVVLDEFIIMPNHIHGILMISGQDVGAKDFSPLQSYQPNKFKSPSKSIGSIVRGYKIGVTKWFRNNTEIYTVWQRNYYEHIIRDGDDLNRIQNYINHNPLNWKDDKYNL